MSGVNFFVLAIPFLLGGVVCELLIQLKGKKLYRFDDLITNLSCGVGQQSIDIFLKLLVIGLYGLVYEYFRLFSIKPGLIEMILLFILVDFCFYWFHFAAHKISLFWGTHIVHHQSDEFNLSVALRQSWFDNLFNIFFYLPLAVLGYCPESFFMIFSINTIYQFIIHTKLIKKMGWFEYFMNTPSHHRVHHASNEKYLDKNFGGVFIVWDKLFGTFQQEDEEVTYGITTPIKSSNPLYLNFIYWIQLFKNSKQRRGLVSKIKFVFSSPEITGVDIENREELQGQNSFRLIYVGLSFVITLGVFVIVMNYETTLTFWEKLCSIVYILVSLTSIGMILSNTTSYFFEICRLLILLFLLVYVDTSLFNLSHSLVIAICTSLFILSASILFILHLRQARSC